MDELKELYNFVLDFWKFAKEQYADSESKAWDPHDKTIAFIEKYEKDYHEFFDNTLPIALIKWLERKRKNGV